MSDKKRRREGRAWVPEDNGEDYIRDHALQGGTRDTYVDRVMSWAAPFDHRSEALRTAMENEPWLKRQASKLLYRTAEAQLRNESIPKKMWTLAADLATLRQKAIGTGARLLVRGLDRGFTAPAVSLAHNEALNWYRVMKDKEAEAENLHPDSDLYKKLKEEALEAKINYEKYAEKEALLLQADRDGAVQSNDNPYAGGAVTRYLLSGIEEMEDDPLLGLGLKGSKAAMTTPALLGLSKPIEHGSRAILSGLALTGAHQLGKAIDPSERRNVDSIDDILKEAGISSAASVVFLPMFAAARAAAGKGPASIGEAGSYLRDEIVEDAREFLKTNAPTIKRLYNKFVTRGMSDKEAVEKALEEAFKEEEALQTKRDEIHAREFPEATSPADEQVLAQRNIGNQFKEATGKKVGKYGENWSPQTIEGEAPAEGVDFVPENVSDALAFVNPDLALPLSRRAFDLFSRANPGNLRVQSTQAAMKRVQQARITAKQNLEKFQKTKARLDAELANKEITEAQYNQRLKNAFGGNQVRQSVDALKQEVGWSPRLPGGSTEAPLLPYSEFMKMPEGRSVNQLIRMRGLREGGGISREDYFASLDEAAPELGVSRAEEFMLNDMDPMGTYLRELNKLKTSRGGVDIGPTTYGRQQAAEHLGGTALREAQEQQIAYAMSTAEARKTLEAARKAISGKNPADVASYLRKNPNVWVAAQKLANEPGYSGLAGAFRKALMAGENVGEAPGAALLPKSNEIGFGEGTNFWNRSESDILKYRPEEATSSRFAWQDTWTDANGKLHFYDTDKAPLPAEMSPEEAAFLEETRVDQQLGEVGKRIADYQKTLDSWPKPPTMKDKLKGAGRYFLDENIKQGVAALGHGAIFLDDFDREDAERAARAAAKDKTAVKEYGEEFGSGAKETLRYMNALVDEGDEPADNARSRLRYMNSLK